MNMLHTLAPANDDGICANILEQPSFDFISRYLCEPAFRAVVDAETERMRERVHVDLDRQILAVRLAAHPNDPDEPAWVDIVRERIAEFDGRVGL